MYFRLLQYYYIAFATPEYHYSAAANNTMTLLQAQGTVAKEVKGIVVNEEGNPIKGATVIISGTSTEVSTDASGHFIIGNVPEEAHLIVSSKGCVSQYLEPAFSSEMTVKMLLDKGSLYSLLVRASYKKGPYPLVILDGVEISNGIDEIDENEINSMGGFPEESASTLLGEKGKNGVLIITTKKKASGSVENKPAEENTTAQQTPSAPSVKVAKVVKGTVVQEDGKPLPGVTIGIIGESRGTISDEEGHFVIGNVPEDASLVFSYGGYKTQMLKAVFTSEMIVKFLKDPDFNEQVKIRDFSTFTSDTKPLILIDGVESTTGMDMILPNEVSTISVLKDASATAVFGDKGANGVIIVTTKKKAARSIENIYSDVNNATQQKTISGLVTGDDDTPLPAVTIVIKGTTIGTIADASGHFALGNVPDDATLVFSYAGKSIELKPDFNSEMTVKMITDKEKKGSLQIRGYNPNKPPALYVIDGVVSNEVWKELNPNDIQSVSVFKGKRAIDKYGKKAKDGVIEITTKKKTPETFDYKPAETEFPGEEQKIIRGISSRGRSFMYIIDGVPADVTEVPLDPQEIESVTLIKDIVGKSKFGPVGTDGIIFIKTKAPLTTKKKEPES